MAIGTRFDKSIVTFAVVLAAVGCGTATSPEGTGVEKPVAADSASNSTPEETESSLITDDKAGKVLRHAVFFSFKDESSAEDVQKVVDAFEDLPSKISEIVDFQWGTNNSPEGLDDGFSHCFLLTFADEAGRAAYLPHAAHKAFGDILRPHMKDVFVVDYWGTPAPELPKPVLKHAVFFRFKPDAAPEDVIRVEEAFAALPSKVDAMKAFEWGTNNSPEKHDDGFTHCFMVTFDSEEGRATYLPHPDHTAFVELLEPVLDAPRVLDFWTQQ